MNELAVRCVSLDLPDVLRNGHDEEFRFLDWLIDGVSLRDAYADESADSYMTLLQADPSLRADRVESLQRLRGEGLPPPSFEPRYDRTRFDRLLGRRGTPYAPWGTAFQDGRSCLLFCLCGDLDCQTLSTRVVVTAETVEWRDIGWQVTYAPFGSELIWQLDELGQATFERHAYEALINDLLEDMRPFE